MRQWTVDAFASGPFRGNPACVVEPFEAWPDPGWMQALAMENNQAETAFLLRTEAVDRFGLRWFTPTMEMPLCGHATLASGHVLLSELSVGAEVLRFDTLSGLLAVRRAGGIYEMDFPADAARRIEPPAGLEAALGCAVQEVWAGAFLLALAPDEASVRALQPNIAAISTLGEEASQGPGNLIVAARADAGRAYDVVSRFFAPGSGIPEDPATGGAHCMLAPLWAEKLGRNPLRFHQAYPRRGGDLECEVEGDRVLLRGEAVTVLESRLRVPPA